jgi:hypothetical protein
LLVKTLIEKGFAKNNIKTLSISLISEFYDKTSNINKDGILEGLE